MDRNERKKASKKSPRRTQTKKSTTTAEAKPASVTPPPKGRQGRRFTQAQKKHALLLIASGMKRTEVAGAGNGATDAPKRARRGKPGTQTRPRPHGPPRQPSTLPAS